MSPESNPTPRVCSVTDLLAIVGDRYALLVARELRFGLTRFQDIAGTGALRDGELTVTGGTHPVQATMQAPAART